MNLRTFRALTASVLAAACAVVPVTVSAAYAPVAAAPIHADAEADRDEGTPAPSPTLDPPALDHDEIQDRFTSLTGALLHLYAGQSGQTLSSYLRANDVMVAAAGHTDAASPTGQQVAVLTDSSVPGAKPLTGESVAELDAALSMSGFTLDMRNYQSLQDMAADVVAKSHTADGAVTLAGAQWVSQLGTLRKVSLGTPNTPGATMPGIDKGALPFGLLLNQSIAGTVLNAPDLFAQAATSGVGSEALNKVFTDQMLAAWQSSNRSLTDALPDKCTGAMLAVMASGSAQAAKDYSGCAPACVTGGLYLNAQASRLFTPGGLFPNVTDQAWNFETLLQTQQWRTHDLLEQNPAMVQQLLSDDGTGGNIRMCGAASESASKSLGQSLPGVFSTLRTK